LFRVWRLEFRIFMVMFKIVKRENELRAGKLQTMHGTVNTPFFLPIATKGAVKNLTSEELREAGAEIILGNTYHLWLRPGIDVIKKAACPQRSRLQGGRGGLHRFMNWNGPILTDSGGYQVFSLGPVKFRQGRTFAKGEGFNRVNLSEEGVEFRDPVNGKKYFMTPEKSIEIQLALGSDIIMVLDECPPYPCSKDYAKKSLERTTRWAERCFRYFHEQINKNKKKYKKCRPLLFCIVQGSVFKDLRKKSANQLLNMDFSALGGPASGWDGYAIGGVAVGEPREKMKKILQWVLPMLSEDKPRYLMGLGKPEEIVHAVKNGIDMFDCVIPTRNARHGSFFVRESRRKSINGNNFYRTINITNEKFKKDFFPVGKNCDCYTCRNFTRSYLRHLFSVGEPLAGRLATIHNLKFYLDLMKILRK